ncbi:DUF58 domain-containing protein [Solemya velum gill symbiont]|uniref:DUF58 domain-containing protein n=1 Tax=Solemya velum gill symbiont TaxID=2340 RepID=UPI00099694A2|nr:DUF58 domain-containing protein [Solemya velum gill symbiont]
MMQNARQWFRAQFGRWLKKRLPAARSITLDRHRLFVFPSRAGFGFLLFVVVILLVAINYQNNMVFGLAFLLSSLLVITILHTWGNLSGLTVSSLRAIPVFAGESAVFEIRISRPERGARHAITLAWPDGDSAYTSLLEEKEVIVELSLPAHRRGVLRPGRLLIETHYPLGLVRCWSWIDLALETLVYPQPLESEFHSGDSGETDSGEVMVNLAGDDYYGLREYQPGDSLKQVAWKHYARGHDLQTRQFAAYRDHQLWLDYEAFTGGVEARLSALCFEVLRVEANREEYGLRLPGIEIEPGKGDRHREQVLSALALFQGGAG